jgi:hypothetical protein
MDGAWFEIWKVPNTVLVELAVHHPTPSSLASRHDLHENLDLGRLQIMRASTNPATY